MFDICKSTKLTHHDTEGKIKVFVFWHKALCTDKRAMAKPVVVMYSLVAFHNKGINKLCLYYVFIIKKKSSNKFNQYYSTLSIEHFNKSYLHHTVSTVGEQI